EADLAQLELGPMEELLRIAHPDAVFEPEMNVRWLRHHEGEVARPASGPDVVPDQAPADPDPLDRVRHRLHHQVAKHIGERLDVRWVVAEKYLWRKRLARASSRPLGCMSR